MINKIMNDKQAYAAMFYFLDKLYLRTGSDYLGGLLGGMSILEDGFPADPAITNDWQEAIEFALCGNTSNLLKLALRGKPQKPS